MDMKNTRVGLVALTCFIFLPFCASSAWREGFQNRHQLQLVGEGKIQQNLPEIQRLAQAREAAIIDALSHWPEFCPAESTASGAASFRVENQKLRLYECGTAVCKARVIIEKKALRDTCQR